jgi:hypothetical protein
VESSREPESVVDGSEFVGLPAMLELDLLSSGLGAVRIGLAQGFFFCVQKPGPFLQPEELEDNVCEIEPAGCLQQLLRVQCHSFSEKRKGDRSWNDVMDTQVIQLFSRKIRKHCENLPAFEFEQFRGCRGILGMREQPLDDWQNSYKARKLVSLRYDPPNDGLGLRAVLTPGAE